MLVWVDGWQNRRARRPVWNYRITELQNPAVLGSGAVACPCVVSARSGWTKIWLGNLPAAAVGGRSLGIITASSRRSTLQSNDVVVNNASGGAAGLQ